MNPPSYNHATGQLEEMHRSTSKNNRTNEDRNYVTVYDSNENTEVTDEFNEFNTYDFFLVSLYYNVLLMVAYVINFVIDFVSEVE